ncbi:MULTISPECIES: hypothetical protein [unclassified Sporosarcina]|uniref:hypothetical protein n=1 Tax=unclassified Sporosarcina TaxID=2647733 RepID=UPI0012F49F7E|nr:MULTISPECIES: hypothetical protein [unclassified Sporosarcina]
MKHIKFGATGAEEVLQNVAFIMATPYMSCPLDRAFGWKMEIDSPIHLAKARIASQLTEIIHTFEPRAIVTEVLFDGDGIKGKLVPKVKVSINEPL